MSDNIRNLISPYLAIIILFFLISCQPEIPKTETFDNPFSGPSPWPEIRIERIRKLLPEAMKTAGTDAWIILCRENNNDPIAPHIGGENAGGQALFLFYLEGENVKSVVFCPIGEATALADLKIHDEVIPVQRGNSAITDASEYIKTKQFQKIAINSSFENELADGLSFTQRKSLEEALGPEAAKLVTADDLIYDL